MNTILLIHEGPILHYRILVYNYLSKYLESHGYLLKVISPGPQRGQEHLVKFNLQIMEFNFKALFTYIRYCKPEVIILFINHSKPYFYPLLIVLRLTHLAIITWTHGVDLQRKNSWLSFLAHHVEHTLCHGILLYADSLKKYLLKSHLKKAFVAVNTLNLTGYSPDTVDKKIVLAKYHISTPKNLIFVGRLQRRKRIEDLLCAYKILRIKHDAGLVLVGSDVEGIGMQQQTTLKDVFLIGPLYGTDVLDLLSSCDVFCMPAAIGLSIVDAMYCGLPVVTEDLDHGPEIMYLKNGVNGYIVERDNPAALAEHIARLLADEELRSRFSAAARNEIATNGNIDTMCKGFVQCLDFVTGRKALAA
jgi:glycosyltransferase involved in cell wall biosynthesis